MNKEKSVMREQNVTVVIVSYKTALLTIDSLKSVESELKVGNLKVNAIVIDNDSGDEPIIQNAVTLNRWADWVTVIKAPYNGGFAYGNNLAFKYALDKNDVDFFLLLNPDAQLRANAIGALVDFLNLHPKVGIAGSSFENADGSLWPIAFRFPSLFSEIESGLQLSLLSNIMRKWVVPVTMQQDYPTEIDWIAGASMMLRATLVKQLRGFDEGYFLYYEETDLCLRAKRLGFSTWYVPNSRVMHIAGQSTKVTIRDAKPKRLPAYLFESRRRYFSVNHGVLYAIFTDLIAIFSQLLGKFKRIIIGKSNQDIPYFIRDLATHSAIFSSCAKIKPFSSSLVSVDSSKKNT